MGYTTSPDYGTAGSEVLGWGHKEIVNIVLKSFLSTLRKAGCLSDSNTPKRLAR